VARLGVDLAELDELRRRLTRINSAALAGGALDL
jgi:MarR family transcriptional regulator, organic hydroperoxide resistance regulator